MIDVLLNGRTDLGVGRTCLTDGRVASGRQMNGRTEGRPVGEADGPSDRRLKRADGPSGTISTRNLSASFAVRGSDGRAAAARDRWRSERPPLNRIRRRVDTAHCWRSVVSHSFRRDGRPRKTRPSFFYILVQSTFICRISRKNSLSQS